MAVSTSRYSMNSTASSASTAMGKTDPQLMRIMSNQLEEIIRITPQYPYATLVMLNYTDQGVEVSTRRIKLTT